MSHVTALPSILASSMHHIIYIKTENIAVDEIWRIILTSTSTRSYILLYKTILHACVTLLVTLALYSINKCSNPNFHIS